VSKNSKKSKPKKASTSSKNKIKRALAKVKTTARAAGKKVSADLEKKLREDGEHKHGEYNGIMGKGSFTKIGDKFQCLECGAIVSLPDEWVKANPEAAKLLLKGQRKDGPKDPVMIEAGKKAWKTRRENQKKANSDG